MDLLAAHLVGQNEDAAIALDGGDHGEAEAGVAGGGFDDGAARPQPAAPLGFGDHGQADAVLDAAGRVQRLDLGVHGRLEPLRDAPQPYQRRLADRLQNGLLHGCRP